MKKIIISTILCNVFVLVFGQQKEIELDPVTVTSTLSEINASKTGRNIIVLKGKDIAALPVKSLDELLRYIPGIEVKSRGAMGAQSDITIRGGSFQQVLIIIDGLRLNDPNTGHFSSYIPVSPDEIEKIEILKGSSSVIYGSDAVGGVINITTKAFANASKQRSETTAQITGGEYGLINAAAQHLYVHQNTIFQISGLTNNTDGQPQKGIDGFVHNHLIAATFSQKINNWNIGFRSSYDYRKFAAQNYYTSYTSDTAQEKVKTFWNQFDLNYQKQKDKFSLVAGFKNTEDNYLFNSRSVANSSFSNLFQLTSYYEHQLNNNSIITGGAQYLGRNIKSNDRGMHTVSQAAAFAVLQQAISKTISVNGSLRFDWNEVAGWVVVPQLNASYRKNNIQLRASAGNALRYADFTELYNNYNKTLVTNGSIGNPNLTAEKTFNYEAGIDWFAKKYAKISFGIFQRACNNLIDWANTAYADMPRKDNLIPTGNYLLAKNVSQVTTSGAELDMLLSKPLSHHRNISSNFGLVWLNSESNNGQLTLYVSSHAKFLANFSVRYATAKYGISINGLYKTRAAQPGTAILVPVSENYFVMNVKADASLIKNVLTAFVQADNIFNTSYNDFVGTPMPSRWLLAGLRFSVK
ncbi:vitamin B12 transporter BtuB precursor [mine drainage metagenome]|uniref:Vitamin B12 transporter BtuB n=1 Tax=mine drainage metagenome TaxID=410659 RepID=A0A1J5SY53_9ZZZZ